jgi:hypothetical protein
MHVNGRYGNSPILKGDGALTFQEGYVSLRRTLGASMLISVAACRTLEMQATLVVLMSGRN